MGRQPRATLPGGFYHCINRGAGRRAIFHDPLDYDLFLHLMQRSQRRYPVTLAAFCLMPNHWHAVVGAESGERLAQFFASLLNHHTRANHRRYGTIGHGPIYQGRFKSIPVKADAMYTTCRYVERNALAAGLVATTADWPWSSFRLWEGEAASGMPIVERPFFETIEAWTLAVNTPLTAKEIEGAGFNERKRKIAELRTGD